MRSKRPEKDKSVGALAGEVIYIVSPSKMQNELTASFLLQKIGARCLAVENLRDILVLDDESIEPARLVLLDCLGKDPESLLLELESFEERVLSRDLVLLFNVSPSLRIEEEAVMRGVRGFFYTEDTLERFQKGIRAVLEGQLWISREIMTKFILEDRGPRRFFKTSASVLSRREIEILTMAASGATNTEIANELYISRHTVKSHLYNIYKKIKVSNRLQAALWAAENL